MRHLDVAKDIVMKGTSQLTLHASTDPDVASVQVPELELLDSSTLQFSGDLTIDAASSFVIDPAATVTGKAGGVPAGNSMPGCPNDGGSYMGGSHGGFGAGPNAVMTPCGSNLNWPRARGAGGRTGGAGAGGAALVVLANQTLSTKLVLNGLVTVDGGSGSSNGGGGAGGGIAMRVRHLLGSGTIRADGGAGASYGGGSGGRVAVIADIAEEWEGASTACGGLSNNAAFYGGAGTVVWKVGGQNITACPANRRFLTVANCGRPTTRTAHLTDEGVVEYEFEKLTLTGYGGLSIARPAPSARASVTIKALVGDGTGRLHALPGTDMLVLGPVEDTVAMVASTSTAAWRDSFARFTSVRHVFYPTSLALTASLTIDADGTMVLPPRVWADGIDIALHGELGGVDDLYFHDGSLSFGSTGRTQNASAAREFEFRSLHLTQTSFSTSSLSRLHTVLSLLITNSSSWSAGSMSDASISSDGDMDLTSTSITYSGSWRLYSRGDLTLGAGTLINGDHGGYGSNSQGPNCLRDGNGGTGGSFGGRGSRSGTHYSHHVDYNTLNTPCGNHEWPYQMGSGGSSRSTAGAAGGAAIAIVADNVLSIDGTVSVNGRPSYGGNSNGVGGAGSGGGIAVRGDTVRGTGVLRANGGNGHTYTWYYYGHRYHYAGGGSGGRIAVIARDATNWHPQSLSVCGGTAPRQHAGSGTVFVRDYDPVAKHTRRRLYSSNCGRSITWQTSTLTPAAYVDLSYATIEDSTNATFFDLVQLTSNAQLGFINPPPRMTNQHVVVRSLHGDKSSYLKVDNGIVVELLPHDNRIDPRPIYSKTTVQFINATDRRWVTTTDVRTGEEGRITDVNVVTVAGAKLYLPPNLYYGPAVSITNNGAIYGVENSTRSVPGKIMGCMDPTMVNYNPIATHDTDPTMCAGVNVTGPGCTYSVSPNYNASAVTNDGSCTLPAGLVLGCTCPVSKLYDPHADLDDGSCELTNFTWGCTYPTAANYDATATVDDGSCDFGLDDLRSELDATTLSLRHADALVSNMSSTVTCLSGKLDISYYEHSLMVAKVARAQNDTDYAVYVRGQECLAERALDSAGCQAELGELNTTIGRDLAACAQEHEIYQQLWLDEKNNTAVAVARRGVECEQQRAVDSAYCDARVAVCGSELASCRSDENTMKQLLQYAASNLTAAVAQRGRECEDQRDVDEGLCVARIGVCDTNLLACQADYATMELQLSYAASNLTAAVAKRGVECEAQRAGDLLTCNAAIADVASDLAVCTTEHAEITQLWRDEQQNTIDAVARRGVECEQQRSVDASACDSRVADKQSELSSCNADKTTLRANWEAEKVNTGVQVRIRGEECDAQRAVEAADCKSLLTISNSSTNVALAERDTLRQLWEEEKNNTVVQVANTWIACDNKMAVASNLCESQKFTLQSELDQRTADVNELIFLLCVALVPRSTAPIASDTHALLLVVLWRCVCVCDCVSVCVSAECRNETRISIAQSVAANAAVVEARASEHAAIEAKNEALYKQTVAEAQLAAANNHIAHLATRVQLLTAALEHTVASLQNTHRSALDGVYPPPHLPRALPLPPPTVEQPLSRRLSAASDAADAAFRQAPRVNDTVPALCGDACEDATAGLNCTHAVECASFVCHSNYTTNTTNATCYEWWMDCMVDHSEDDYFTQPRFLQAAVALPELGGPSHYYPIKCNLGPPASCLQQGVCKGAYAAALCAS